MDQNHQTLLKANKPALLEYLGMDFFVLVNPGSDRYVFWVPQFPNTNLGQAQCLLICEKSQLRNPNVAHAVLLEDSSTWTWGISFGKDGRRRKTKTATATTTTTKTQNNNKQYNNYKKTATTKNNKNKNNRNSNKKKLSSYFHLGHLALMLDIRNTMMHHSEGHWGWHFSQHAFHCS